MIIPSVYHLQKFLDTLAGRDEDDHVTVTMSIADLRMLVQGDAPLTNDSQAPYTSGDVNRR